MSQAFHFDGASLGETIRSCGAPDVTGTRPLKCVGVGAGPGPAPLPPTTKDGKTPARLLGYLARTFGL